MASRPEKIVFEGAHGLKLAARLDRPKGPPKAYALFAHCFTCTKDIFAASRIASALAESGIAVLRFDFTGLGSSEGEFEKSVTAWAVRRCWSRRAASRKQLPW